MTIISWLRLSFYIVPTRDRRLVKFFHILLAGTVYTASPRNLHRIRERAWCSIYAVVYGSTHRAVAQQGHRLPLDSSNVHLQNTS
jgi:hypothetical protein